MRDDGFAVSDAVTRNSCLGMAVSRGYLTVHPASAHARATICVLVSVPRKPDRDGSVRTMNRCSAEAGTAAAHETTRKTINETSERVKGGFMTFTLFLVTGIRGCTRRRRQAIEWNEHDGPVVEADQEDHVLAPFELALEFSELVGAERHQLVEAADDRDA